ncbi:MAG: NUDIX domain-containing protein [Oscillospiraceae bacterium]|nr:NUDIX domain-containing protein [Oscillospiraceae bacterium]
MNMNFCPECGLRLKPREHPTDGMVPYCSRCEEYRYPVFQTAIAVILLSPDRKRMLLIRQYGDPYPVHVAGYVDKGETAEEAVRREVAEELGMTIRQLRFYRSHYYTPSETLMLSYSAVLCGEEAHPNTEVDSWEWVRTEEAGALVKPGDLADTLLNDYYRTEGTDDEQLENL